MITIIKVGFTFATHLAYSVIIEISAQARKFNITATLAVLKTSSPIDVYISNVSSS